MCEKANTGTYDLKSDPVLLTFAKVENSYDSNPISVWLRVGDINPKFHFWLRVCGPGLKIWAWPAGKRVWPLEGRGGVEEEGGERGGRVRS